jgi:hypothetical protein
MHKHEWLEVRLFADWDWNSDEVQDILEKLSQRYGPLGGLGLSPISEESGDWSDVESGPSEVGEIQSADDKMQASFQLALLHAFDRLSIRRSLFSAYLSLGPAVEVAIAPWAGLIQECRKRRDRVNLSYESSWQRRVEELSYIKRGLTTRYVDEDDIRYGQVLEDIGQLHEGEDAAKHAHDGQATHDDDDESIDPRERRAMENRNNDGEVDLYELYE